MFIRAPYCPLRGLLLLRWLFVPLSTCVVVPAYAET